MSEPRDMNPCSIPKPVGRLLSRLPSWPGSLLFVAALNAILTPRLPDDVRDMMAGEKPYIFVKHFYACSSIIGAAVCVEVWKLFGSAPAMIAGTAAVIILRVCAAAFRWSLPKIENLPSDMKDGR